MNNVTTRLSLLTRIGIALALIAGASQAMAAPTASNATLENTATASFSNLGGTPQTPVTVTAQITVLLTPVTPDLTLSSTTPTDLTTLAENQTISLFYDVTSNSNGPDDYNLALSETSFTGLNTGTAGATTDVGILGATTIVEDFTILNTAGAGAGQCSTPDGGTGTCSIKVANDDASDAVVNGLSGFDTVVFTSGIVCTVASVDDTNGGQVTDPGVGSGFSLVTVQGCSGAGLQSLGDGIFERKTIQYDYTTGTLSASPTPGTGTLSTVAQDDGAVASASAAVTSNITVLAARIVIHKLVRNVTDPITGSTADPGTDVNGNQIIGVLSVDDESGGGPFTYYKTGVTAEPGDVLQYAIVIENVGAAVTDVVIDDSSTIFTTYTANSVRLMEEGSKSSCSPAWTCTVTITPATNVVTGLTDAVDGDQAKVVSGTDVSIYAGAGGDDSGNGGNLAASKVTVGFYSVTVD